MNGYDMIVKGLKQAVKNGKISQEDVSRKIEIYEFLATCNNDDLCCLIDSSAFNDIINAYIKKAIEILSVEEQEKVEDNLRYLFDEKTAKEVIEEK